MNSTMFTENNKTRVVNFKTAPFNQLAPQEGETERVTFTPEQQARIDEIVRESMGRAGREARAQAETVGTELTAVRAQLQEAQTRLSAAPTAAAREAAQGDVANLQAEMSEIKRIAALDRAEVERFKKLSADKDAEISTVRKMELNTRKQVAINMATSKLGFVDSGLVAKVTDDQIQWDEDKKKFVVVENGATKMNNSYADMTLDEFYKEFATNNPFLVRGTVVGGVGSTEASRSGLSMVGKYTVEQIFGPKSNGGLANSLSLKDPKEYNRLREVAVEQGLVASRGR